MAVYLPDGSTVALATTYAAAKTITAISNANPAVVSCTAHGLTDGDLIELTSGWSRLNGRTFRVASSLTDTFALEDVDTTDTAVFAAGSGVGTFKEISAWTSVTQILKFEVSGGEQQFATYQFLEADSESKVPTITSAMSVDFSVADDPALDGFKALKTAGEARAIRTMKVATKDGSIILYCGYISFNDSPKMSAGNIMECSGALAMIGKNVRYD